MKFALVSTLSVVLFACSHDKPAETATTTAGPSASAAAPASPDTKHDERAESGEHDHGPMSPTVKAFHDELAPLWHAEQGAARTKDTCTHAPSLQQRASAVGDSDLIAAMKALADECKKFDMNDFERKFADVHAKFHKAAEASQKK